MLGICFDYFHSQHTCSLSSSLPSYFWYLKLEMRYRNFLLVYLVYVSGFNRILYYSFYYKTILLLLGQNNKINFFTHNLVLNITFSCTLTYSSLFLPIYYQLICIVAASTYLPRMFLVWSTRNLRGAFDEEPIWLQ